VITYLLFLLLRVLVLRGKNAPTKSIWCLPALLLFTLFVNIFFILYKVTPRGGCQILQQMRPTICPAERAPGCH
jgi:hypothetical protein